MTTETETVVILAENTARVLSSEEATDEFLTRMPDDLTEMNRDQLTMVCAMSSMIRAIPLFLKTVRILSRKFRLVEIVSEGQQCTFVFKKEVQP
jgi:hypothetical protein